MVGTAEKKVGRARSTVSQNVAASKRPAMNAEPLLAIAAATPR